MITELTKEQIAKFPEYVEKWSKIGLDTKPIDKEAAKIFVKKLYKFLGRTEDPEVIFASGPVDAWNIIEKNYKEKIEFVWPYLDGQFWASYIAWIKYYQEVVGIKIEVDISIIEEVVNFGNIYPLDKCCIFVEKMKVCKKNANGLHCEEAPAVEYNDGTKIFALNGVVVPEWLAVTPAGKIKAKDFSTITNAEIRREFVRKVGIERICQEMETVLLDKSGDYELHEVDLKGATGKWPYLKMLNPSIGVWHMECVDRSCKTVKDALKWRNQSEIGPSILT